MPSNTISGSCNGNGIMQWPASNPLLHNTFASLGKRHGDTYNVSKDCLSILEEILRKLAVEDQTLRTFRRAIGFGQNIAKDLIPLLIHVKDDTKNCHASKIIDTTIKILVNLTIPVECLLSIDAVSRTDVGRHTIFELQRLLTTSKEAFTDSRSTKAVVDHIKHVVEQDTILDVQQCDSINNCLSLLRNILHIPDERAAIAECALTRCSMQNEIIWNLFTQSIDKIVIYLMACPQKMYWGVTMVQLIALMYKDQHVGTLQKLLNLWLETSLSESSEDNESNTSPPDQGSGDSSPIITSDPTSDSSDNGSGNCNERTFEPSAMEAVRAAHNRSKTLAGMKRVKSTETELSSSSGVSSMGQHDPNTQYAMQGNGNNITAVVQSSQGEVSDCGYGTQVENQESISTSSNDDDQPTQKPVHQKPHTFQKTRYSGQKNRAAIALEKKELRRKKLVKRSKTNIINMKGLMHHQPTDEDIANILKEFTVDFLLKSYASLVNDLYTLLLGNVHVPIDTSHFFWLITYFLKFATQLELDLEHVSPVLSYEIISYIIFQGVWIYEELELSRAASPDCDLKPCLRRLHLVVTAIREFLQTVETYHKLSHLSDDDRAALRQLEEQIADTQDLKRLFLLLLQQYNPTLQSRQYLQDLIVTNHTYLLFLDKICKVEDRSANIMEHLKQFATVEIMRQYGLLLEYFQENGEFVNNCIFTMMHHIGGDLEHFSSLYQPSILKTFSKIWETDYEICDDWCDLIEYVIHKFINTPRPNRCPSLPLQETTAEEHKGDSQQEASEALHRPSLLGRGSMDLGSRQKTHQVIIKELLDQNIITPSQYDEYMAHPRDSISVDSSTAVTSTQDGDVRALREYLHHENQGTQVLVWLQQVTIEACFVKLVLANQEILSNHIAEPSVYHYALLQLPIPVIPWTFDQSNSLKQPSFIRLLHKLGFYLPVDTGKIFVRIPDFWTPDYLFGVALQLGPVDTNKLKFDVSLLDGQKKNEATNDVACEIVNGGEKRKFSMSDLKQTPSMVRYSPLPNSTEWVQQILYTKTSPIMDPLLQIPSSHNIAMPLPETPATCSGAIIKPEKSDMDMPLGDDNNDDDSDTASVTSDLTRMCVSDEEEKTFMQSPKNI